MYCIFLSCFDKQEGAGGLRLTPSCYCRGLCGPLGPSSRQTEKPNTQATLIAVVI